MSHEDGARCALCGDVCPLAEVDHVDQPDGAVTICDDCFEEFEAWPVGAWVWLPWELDFDPAHHGFITEERPLPHCGVA